MKAVQAFTLHLGPLLALTLLQRDVLDQAGRGLNGVRERCASSAAPSRSGRNGQVSGGWADVGGSRHHFVEFHDLVELAEEQKSPEPVGWPYSAIMIIGYTATLGA